MAGSENTFPDRPSPSGKNLAAGHDFPLAKRGAASGFPDPVVALASRLGQRQPPQYLSSEQVRTLIEAAKRPRTRLLIKLLYQTGARISEALAIRGADIDLENRRVRIVTLKQRGKSKKVAARWMPMPDDLAADLAAWLVSHPVAETARLFPTDRRTAWRSIRTAADSVNLVARGGRRVSPHILRHSYAMRLVDSGVPLSVVKELLGHEWVNNTMVYLRVSDSDLRAHVAQTRF